MTHEGDGEERQAPDETMQLKLPDGFRPDETMQLRVSDLEIPDGPEIPEGETKPVRHRGRKAPGRPSAPVSPASPQSSAPASPRSPHGSHRP